MKKEFKKPELDIIEIVNDIVTTSGTGLTPPGDPGGGGTPMQQ